MKYTLSLVLFVFLFCSCNTKTADTEGDVMSGDSSLVQLKAELGRKDSTINAFMASMNSIEDNLVAIKEKQKMVSQKSTDVEMQKTQPESIVEDIASINSLLEQNRKTINALNEKLKRAHINNDELQKLIERLTKQLDDKDKEILALRTELEQKNVALKTLFSEYNDRIHDLGNQQLVINTAYYAFGSAKELKEQGVLTKEGGFIGLNKQVRLSDQMNKSYFTKIDITEFTELPLGAKKAKLVTNHPASSYRLEGDKGAIKLVITNGEDFWSISKYLVVVVE